MELAVPPLTKAETLDTISSLTMVSPPNTTAKPGAAQPAGADTLEHQLSAGS
jgi:hypothetical protein